MNALALRRKETPSWGDSEGFMKGALEEAARCPVGVVPAQLLRASFSQTLRSMAPHGGARSSPHCNWALKDVSPQKRQGGPSLVRTVSE